MGEQENCPPTNRAPKKRPNASGPLKQHRLPSTKKRIVLGDLTNTPTAGLTQIFPDPKTHKPKRPSEKKETTQEKKPREIESVASSADPRKPQKKNETAQEQVSQNLEADMSSNDPQNGAEESRIYNHLRSLEVEESRRPLSNYMEMVQNDVTANMREILVDWLVEVAEEYKLVSDTLYLTISHVDRFLSSHALNRKKLQLLGISCMLMASKYEEITPPHVEDFCYVTDNTYTKEEVVSMERDVLKLLNFQLGTPTIKTFLRSLTRFSQESCKLSNLRFEFLGCYLAELSLLDYGCVRFLPSMIAASVIFLTRFIIQPHVHPWNLALQRYSGYTSLELKDCIFAVHAVLLSQRPSSRAVRNKYMQHKFKCIATLTSPSEIPACYFDAINR